LRNAFAFFNEINTTTSPYIRKKVVVYGGGKLALYLARIIKRFYKPANLSQIISNR
jgi:hypothetical protein